MIPQFYVSDYCKVKARAIECINRHDGIIIYELRVLFNSVPRGIKAQGNAKIIILF